MRSSVNLWRGKAGQSLSTLKFRCTATGRAIIRKTIFRYGAVYRIPACRRLLSNSNLIRQDAKESLIAGQSEIADAAQHHTQLKWEADMQLVGGSERRP